jgi:hypothetical protein
MGYGIWDMGYGKNLDLAKSNLQINLIFCPSKNL